MAHDRRLHWSEETTLERRAAALVRRCAQAIHDNRARAADACAFARLVDYTDATWGNIEIARTSEYWDLVNGSRIYRNTAQSIYRTEIAKVASLTEDLPQLMASGADYSRQQAAEDLTHWLEVVYQMPHGDFYDLAELHRHGFGVSCVTGSAAVFPEVTEQGRVQAHLDDTLTMGLDRSDLHSRPLSVVRTRYWLREELEARQSTKVRREAVRVAPAVSCSERLHLLDQDEQKQRGDIIAVCQGWTLNRGEKKGIALECLANGFALDQWEYDSDELPYAMFHCYRSLQCEFGVPLIRNVIDACLAENAGLSRWRENLQNLAHTVAETDDPEVKAQLGALHGLTVIERRPQSAGITWKTPPDNPTDRNFADAMREAAFVTSGVNDDASASRGLGGSSGIHEHYRASMLTERMARESRSLTHWRAVDTAKALIRAALMARERYPDAKVTWRSGRRERELVLKDLDLEGADQFVLQVAAVDGERATPAARLKLAEQMMQSGQMTPAEYFEVARDFDVAAASEEADSALLWVDEQIQEWRSIPEKELDEGLETLEGVVETLTPFVGVDVLQRALRKVAFAHTEARASGASPARLELFETFMSTTYGTIQRLLRDQAALAAPQAAPAPMPGAPPMGGPPPAI